MKDNISTLYGALKNKGYTDIGKDEAEFRNWIGQEGNVKKLHGALSQQGFDDIGDENTFSEWVGLPKKQSGNEPYTHEYDKDMNLVGGTAYQAPEPYQYKPEVQQHILQNKPDMFKPKTVDMYGAHSKDKTEMDMLQEGRLYDMKEARQNWLQRPITTFGEAFEQGSEALYQGGKNLVGETANIVTGSQRDYQRAKNQLDELVASGYDLSNFDAEQALKAYKDRDYQRKMNEWQRNIASRKAEREDMGFFGSLLHKMQDPSRPKSQYEETGMFADELQLARSYQAIQDALQKSNGNVQEAYKLLGQKASKETWGDETTREARAELAKQRPTEGFGAWAGGMIPQMIGTGAGIIASLNPYTRWLARPLGMANTAFLTGATSGMSMAEARQYAEEKGMPINEGNVWRTGIVDAAIEYGTENLPFNRYFGRIQDVTKKIIGNSVADAALNNDAVQNEVSDLLQRASKEFGNGLFTKENLKEYLKDVGTEGVSEFMAEALQTLSPIIYQNPEDYPTLAEVLNNGIEGAKGGLFMGAFLGGGSLYSANRMQNYANRKRREKQGSVSFVETDKGIFEVLGQNDGVFSVMDSNGEQSEVTADQVRDQISVSLEEFETSMNEARESHIQDKVEAENAEIDAATDPQTGMYGEVSIVSKDLDGNDVVSNANVFGEKEVNGELYLLVLPEGETEKKWVRPNEYDANSYQKRPAEEVKALNEEMIREEAAQQAEMEAKYAPEVINAQMQQGVPFDTPNAQIVPVAPMPEGNGWIVEEYALDTNNKVAKTPIVRELTNDEYRDMLQALLNAEEAAQEQISAEEQAAAPEVVEEVQPTEEADVKENLTTESRDNLSPVEEVAQPQVEVKPQTPVIPTKEDGSIDFVSYGKEGTFKTLGEKYGEKMPNKVSVTAKALAEDLKKAQNKLQKAEEAYDNAPIGREQKAEEARDKAKQELEAIQREANFWAEMDAEIKDAQARRESMLNPQAEVETSTEPMNVDEFVAQQLASGNIVLDKEDYKKETGYGDVEANAMNGGATKLFGKNGMTIQEAGERLMEIDRENGTNFFDQLDSNSGRDALINVLGSVKSRNELNQYIATNRAEQAKKESEGLRNELEKQAMEANYASLEDYVLQMEAAEMENPFLNDRADEIMAIFAEEAAKYEQSLNNTENGQGTENEVVEGNDSILPEEQLDNTGGTEVSEESERIGDGTSEESESTHAATEVELKQEEGETTLQFAERAAEENRRRPLRKRAEEWSNTLGIKVTYLESIDDVDAKTRAQIEAAHAKGESVPGWVNKKGEVFFFMPDLSDLKDVDDTYIHEVVAHVGLPQLLGKERFGELCDKVWDMMPQSEKDYYYNYPGVNSTDDSTKEGKIERQRRAADEYIAHIAEQQNFTPEEKTIWDNIVKMFREMLDKALNGIISKSKLTDEDISNLIKASYANLKSGAEGNVSGEGTKFRAKWRKGQLDKASRTIRRWLENNTRGKSFEIELPKATLDKVRKAMGRDFESHNITSNGIVHALKNHGENGLKLTGISIPLSKEDVELIPYIMTSPDRVEKASTDASGRESVRFYKDLSNGYVVVVEKEYKNSPDDMETITMWAELSSKATNAQQNAAPDTHVRNAILSIDIAKIRKDAEDAIEEDENLKEKTSFRVVKDKNGNKSLVGLHNISEDKLKKAIKQGGLANPSMAVIDMDKQSHVDYGDITLVAPASLIDKNEGKNAGTYMGDAWTPVYPKVTLKLDNKGWKKINQYIESIVEDRELQNNMKYGTEMYMEGESGMYMNFAFLKEKGLDPEIFYKNNDGYISTDDIKKLLGVEEIDTSFEGYSKLKDLPEETLEELKLWARTYGNKNKIDAHKKRLEEIKNQYGEDSKAYKLMAKPSDELGYGEFDRLVVDTKRKERDNGKIDSNKTFNEANYYVAQNGLRQEFEKWMDELLLDAGAKEVFFAGYTPSGNKRYMANTIENVSKFMNKQSKTNAYDETGFGATKALFLKKLNTLEEIREQKDKLVELEEYRETTKELSDRMGDLISRLSDMQTISSNKFMNYDYAASRLQEAMTKRNPIKHLNDEYGYGLDKKGSFAEDLTELIKDIKDSPARYFETKFERPVYLNEFVAAVVPQGTSKDVVDALTKVGLPIEEYESGNNEARMAAVDKVSSETEGVRFRFIGERGARNLDKAEEATTRLDNLGVAREMEAADKDAKTIKMATGWERGADGLWRYETMDSETAIKDGDEAEIRKQIEDIEEEEKAYKKKAKAEGIDEDERYEAYISFNRRSGFLEAQLAYVMVKNADVLTHIDVSLYHVLDKENSENLFKAYPELEFVRVGFATEIHGKSLGATIVNGSRVEAIHLDVKRSTPEELNGYLAHEIQHAIQEIEGFAPGGDPSMESPRKAEQKSKNISFMKDKLDKSVSERKSLLKQRDEVNDKMSAWWAAHEDATREDMLADKEMQEYNREYDELSKQIDEADKTVKFNERWLDATLQANTSLGYEGYKKLAGEVEARNVMSRLGMTLEQRRNSLASETEDVAREDQIFLKDGIESGMRFRISEKGKQIQAEVDKFTSKYNSKPVSVVDSGMTDEELEEAMPVFLADDTRKMISEGKLGSYSPKAKRIFIFADNNTPESLEDTLFHENLHTIFADHPMIEEFFNDFNAMYPEQIEMLSEGYEKSEIPEEVFVSVLAASMQRGNFKIIDASFSEDSRQELYNTLKEFGYDYEQESRGRIRKGNNGESSEVVRDEEADERNGRTLHEDGSINRTDGRGPEGREKLQESEGSVKSATERKERLTDLFNKVADMGLQGVLGNKNYTSLMVDIYKALPEEVRAEIADDALRLYGGSIAPAVSDYIGPKSKNSIMDKVVTIVREALRKVGFDLDLNANEVRYMAWRSKKPLDRNNLLEMAEDIDMKYRLKVGEYDGTTPDGGGTRFRVTPKMDAEYLEAVNSGDNKKVAKLVKDAAKAAMPNTKVVDRWGKPKVVYHGTISPERFNEFKGETIFFTSSYADANLYSHKREGGWLSPKQSGRPLSFFLNIENPLVIDAKGRRWSDIPVDWTTQSLTTDDVAQYAKDNGYDGVIINKVKDSIFTDMSPMTVYIAFSSNQIKDAGTTHIYDNSGYGSWRIKDEIGATYDDNGNVIPLSERFNPEQKDIRFRVSGKLNVRDEYEATIKKGGYQAREAVQDAMLSLRKFQEMIEKATGKKIRDFENAWMHENRLSSVVQAEIHDMERKFYKPMMDAVKKLMSVANLEQEQVADYLMLKHGIERNREMAVRKALTDDKGKIDRTKLEQWYQEKDAIRNDATLDTWRKKQEAMDNAALNYGADMSHDYSGLTSMFGTDDLADSTQKAYDEVEALENAHPVETESLGKAIKAMTQNTLEKSFESGLMDRKVYDELSKDMYDYYIPLRGFEETTSEEVYAYLDQDRGAFNAPLKRAKGRSSKSDNPIAYLKSIAESGIMQGNRNKMKQSFLNMVINNPSDLVSVREGVWVIYNPASGEWEAASAPAIPNNATPADVEVAMEAWEQQMEQAALKDPTLVKKVAEAADVPYRVVGNKMDQHQVVVKRLGKSYTLTVNGNPRLAMALNGQTNPNNTSNDGKVATYVNNKIGALNRSLAAWYTTRNPDFVASNFMRDTFYTNTIVRAKEGNAYANKFHKNYAMALPKMLSLFGKYEKGTLNPANKTEADFLDFMMNGGETGYSNLKDVEEIKKQIAKELKGNRFAKVEALAEKLDILNRAVENTARFAAYLTSREEGRSIAKSIFDAKEISVNFNKKGAGGTFFGMTGQTWFGNLAALVGASGRALYVFFNAAIQGSTNLMHVMKVNPKGTSAGLAAMFLMGAIVPFLFGDDDDEKGYYDLPEHVRRNHLIIPGTGDAWISIPLPIEYRIMYGIGELLTSWRTGHERGSDIARKMLSMSGQALPLNFLEEGLEAFVPSAVSPIYQVMTNSSWTGLPIYKENDFNKDDPEYTKAYSNVDRNLLKLTKALYEWTFDEENQKERIDLNPAIIETLAKGYFGGLATQLSNIAKVGGMIAGEQEFDWRNIPIGNRVLKTGDERTKEKRVTNEYFENMEKLDFLQSRERMLKKTEKGVAVPEADKSKAQKDLEAMQGTEVYKKYQEFKKQKKVVDKIRKTIKEKGSTPEREKQLIEAQEKANKSVR